MPSFSADSAGQVWQRVTAPPDSQADPRALHGLILSARQQMGLYQRLAAQLSGNAQTQCRKLWEGQQRTVAALNGILRLSGGATPTGRLPEAALRNPKQALAEGYRRAQLSMGEYAARSISPEFSPVFRSLSQREEGHCAILAELLGALG